jgi:hypothetical protein
MKPLLLEVEHVAGFGEVDFGASAFVQVFLESLL